MNGNQYAHLKNIEVKKRKTHHQLTYRSSQESIYNLSANLTNSGYINAFNLFINRLRDHEYRPKNPELYTWRQSIKHYTKLKMPQAFLEQENNKVIKRDIDRRQARKGSDMALSRQSENDISVSPSRKQSSIPNKLMVAVDLSAGIKKFVPRKGSTRGSRTERGTLESAMDESIHLSRVDFQMPTRHRAISLMKIQSDLILHRGSSMQEIPNLQYIQDQFNRKNMRVNKILSEVNLGIIDKEKIKEETIKKIKEATKGYQLHEFIVPKDLTKRSASVPRIRVTKGLSAVDKSNSVLPTNQSVIDRRKMSFSKPGEILNTQESGSQNILSQSIKDKNEFDSRQNILEADRSVRGKKAFSSSPDKAKQKSLVRKLDLALRKLDNSLNLTNQTQGDHSAGFPNTIMSATLNLKQAYKLNTEVKVQKNAPAESERRRKVSYNPNTPRNNAAAQENSHIQGDHSPWLPNTILSNNKSNPEYKAQKNIQTEPPERRRKVSYTTSPRNNTSVPEKDTLEPERRRKPSYNANTVVPEKNGQPEPERRRKVSYNTNTPRNNTVVPEKVSTPNGHTSQFDENNFLNYNAYYKRKYMEKGTDLEVSQGLYDKMKEINKSVGKAIKEIDNL